MENMESYLTRLREALARGCVGSATKYLDLSIGSTVSPAELSASATALPADNLAEFQELLMNQIARYNIDKIKVGINELLKHLLTVIVPELEQTLAQHCLYRLRLIFKRCLLADFPYPEDIWNYICECLQTSGIFLMDNGFFTAAREVIDSLAAMGRIAALKGLPTATTQSALRILENRALEKNEKQLASTAKNARFNLET